MVCYYRLSNFDYEPARNRFEVTTGNFTNLNDSSGIFELPYYDIYSQINRPKVKIVKLSIKEIVTVSILLYILLSLQFTLHLTPVIVMLH
jgi:hypothetical protein